jgi:hypothetical protein
MFGCHVQGWLSIGVIYGWLASAPSSLIKIRSVFAQRYGGGHSDASPRPTLQLACSEIVTSAARVVVRAVVVGLELDKELLLLLVVSPATTSASKSSKSSSANCRLPFFLWFGILREGGDDVMKDGRKHCNVT